MNDIAARSSSGETDVSVDTSVVNSLLVFHEIVRCARRWNVPPERYIQCCLPYNIPRFLLRSILIIPECVLC